MYLAAARLPHLLPPQAYWDPGFARRERETVFKGAWRLAGSLADLPRDGDRRGFVLDDRPLVLRNHGGEIGCFDDLPQALARRLPTARCGQLVFVRLDEDGPSIEDFLGDAHAILAEHFGPERRQTLRLDVGYPANWKVAVENSLETYHSPTVHPRTFAGDGGEDRAEHRLKPGGTEFLTSMAFSGRHPLGKLYLEIDQLIWRRLGEAPDARYRHVHVFPNLTFATIDGLSMIQAMEPAGATTSRGVVRQFTLSRRAWSPGARALSALWGRIAARTTRQIMAEDIAIYGRVQRGLEGSPNAGMLGRCEERIHAFQAWMVERMAAVS